MTAKTKYCYNEYQYPFGSLRKAIAVLASGFPPINPWSCREVLVPKFAILATSDDQYIRIR
jgi:hypothetical protein